MEGALSEFFSLQTVIFVLIVYLATATFRKIVESIAPKIAPIFPNKYESWWIEFWEEWILLAAPSIIGGLIAFFISSYPYPEIFSSSMPGRVFFGIVAGLACNNTYKFFKYYVRKFLPKKVEEEEKKMSLGVPEESKESD